MNPCPIQKDLETVKETAHSFAHQMRSLRHKMHQCRDCQGDDCPILKEFTSQIDQAIVEVNQEWGIAIIA